jgi:hypothetical protein
MVIGVALPYTKKDEMGRARGMYGQEERSILGFGEENLGKINHLEHLGVDERVIKGA